MSHVLADYDTYYEVINALVVRDVIQQTIEAGQRPSPEAERLLAEADARVLADRFTIVERFPEVFEDRAPRRYWWWHLDDSTALPLPNDTASSLEISR
jgi:hypothetical protein